MLKFITTKILKKNMGSNFSQALTVKYSCIFMKNLDALKSLTRLERLGLDNNKIKDIDALRQLTGLFTLGLNQNQIKNLDALKNLFLLSGLGLDNNRIENLDEFDST